MVSTQQRNFFSNLPDLQRPTDPQQPVEILIPNKMNRGSSAFRRGGNQEKPIGVNLSFPRFLLS
jgi:hypothetical protein